jgi:hypothetical protein
VNNAILNVSPLPDEKLCLPSNNSFLKELHIADDIAIL